MFRRTHPQVHIGDEPADIMVVKVNASLWIC